MEKPLYTLNSLRPLIKTARKFGFTSSSFSIECRAQEGFTISFKDGREDFFQVINTFQNAIIFFNLGNDKEENLIYPFEQVDHSLRLFKEVFERWLIQLRTLQVVN
jgi:hypothetical protein